jgi:hypothetical protein
MRQLIGVLLGLATGLPQGIGGTTNFFSVESLPHTTVHIIIAFGLFGGVLMGLSLLRGNRKMHGKLLALIDKYVDLYFYMMVGMLSLAAPIFIQVGVSDPYASALFNGWFFGSVGLGLVLAAILMDISKRVFQ